MQGWLLRINSALNNDKGIHSQRRQQSLIGMHLTPVSKYMRKKPDRTARRYR